MVRWGTRADIFLFEKRVRLGFFSRPPSRAHVAGDREMALSHYPTLRLRVARLGAATLIVSSLTIVTVPDSISSALAQSPGCAAMPGVTLRGSARLRVFSAEESEGVRQVFVCQKETSTTRRLGVRAAIVGRPIALSGLWAAAVEERGKPQDELIRDVVARDVESGVRNLCRIGLANRPGQLITVSALVVTGGGDIGWSGPEKIGMAQPVVGACVGGTDQILARGPGLDLKSLDLSGETLTWSNEGRRESFRLG
jgi:hypothetical protein